MPAAFIIRTRDADALRWEPIAAPSLAATAAACGCNSAVSGPECVATFGPGADYTVETTPDGSTRIMRQPRPQTADSRAPQSATEINDRNKAFWTKRTGEQTN